MESTFPKQIVKKKELINSLVRLSGNDKQIIIADTIKEKDAFLLWSEQEYPQLVLKENNKSLKDRIADEPSKKLLRNSLIAVSLANMGMTSSAMRLDLELPEIMLLWGGTIGAPILEELIFRSSKIPRFFERIGDVVGVEITPDRSRLSTNILFSLGHMDPFHGDAKFNSSQALNAFLVGGALQKITSEKGLAASMAAHAIWNATMLYSNFLVRDQARYIFHNDKEAKTYKIVSTLNRLMHIGALAGVGIFSVKEFVEDKKIQTLRETILNAKGKNVAPLLSEVNTIFKKLLSHPSPYGYKFQTGVELAYTHATLTMPIEVKEEMAPDEYARSQVYKLVKEAWKDDITIQHRLERANTFINEKLANLKNA